MDVYPPRTLLTAPSMPKAGWPTGKSGTRCPLRNRPRRRSARSTRLTTFTSRWRNVTDGSLSQGLRQVDEPAPATGGHPRTGRGPRTVRACEARPFFLCFREESRFNLLPFFHKYGLGRGQFSLGEAVRSQVPKLPVREGNRQMEGVGGRPKWWFLRACRKAHYSGHVPAGIPASERCLAAGLGR
jgi:hypothetical protein